MQKTAKKFLSMLLALMMVLSILPTAVFATEQGTVAAPLDSIVPYGRSVIIGSQKTQIYQRFAGSQQEVFILYFRCILNSKQSDFTDFFHS